MLCLFMRRKALYYSRISMWKKATKTCTISVQIFIFPLFHCHACIFFTFFEITSSIFLIHLRLFYFLFHLTSFQHIMTQEKNITRFTQMPQFNMSLISLIRDPRCQFPACFISFDFWSCIAVFNNHWKMAVALWSRKRFRQPLCLIRLQIFYRLFKREAKPPCLSFLLYLTCSNYSTRCCNLFFRMLKQL